MYLWVFTACVLGEGVEERDAFVVGWSFFHILLNCGPFKIVVYLFNILGR